MSGLSEEDPFHEGVVWAIRHILDQINEVDGGGGDKSIHEALERRDERVKERERQGRGRVGEPQ